MPEMGAIIESHTQYERLILTRRNFSYSRQIYAWMTIPQAPWRTFHAASSGGSTGLIS